MLPEKAMDQLGIEFEKFDTESKTQMFIDKESVAQVSDNDRLTVSRMGSHSDLHDSLQSYRFD